MELEKQKFPWMDAMEFELNHRVTHYLMTEHKDYCNLREQIKELMDKFPAIAKLIDERRELHLSEQEQEARKNCKEYGEIEKKISELYSKYSFIDSFTDNSKMKEGRSFSSEELQRVSDCLDLEDDKRYIEQTELYLKGIRDGYALKKFLEK